jgi:hypothetical protein
MTKMLKIEDVSAEGNAGVKIKHKYYFVPQALEHQIPFVVCRRPFEGSIMSKLVPNISFSKVDFPELCPPMIETIWYLSPLSIRFSAAMYLYKSCSSLKSSTCQKTRGGGSKNSAKDIKLKRGISANRCTAHVNFISGVIS